jgi:hypothetical protein
MHCHSQDGLCYSLEREGLTGERYHRNLETRDAAGFGIRRHLSKEIMNTLNDYDIAPIFSGDEVIVRIARKDHRCSGGHDGHQRTNCGKPIGNGSVYIEYLGESAAYESGYRYHVDCALQQGLLIAKEATNA